LDHFLEAAEFVGIWFMLKGSRQKSSEQFGEAQNNIFRLMAKLLIPSQNHISSSIADLQSETKPMALRVKITNHPSPLRNQRRAQGSRSSNRTNRFDLTHELGVDRWR
jgi:hypothetical protein